MNIFQVAHLKWEVGQPEAQLTLSSRKGMDSQAASRFPGRRAPRLSSQGMPRDLDSLPITVAVGDFYTHTTYLSPSLSTCVCAHIPSRTQPHIHIRVAWHVLSLFTC